MKTKVLKASVLICLTAIYSCGFSQEAVSSDEKNKIINNSKELPPKAEKGTYQFIRVSKEVELFSNEWMDELLVLAEKMRHATEEVNFNISNYTKLRILPQAVIDASDFVPLEEFVSAPCDEKD